MDFKQFGFTKGKYTSDACLVLKETVHMYMKNGNSSYVYFMDLSKAFDREDHIKLLTIILKEGLLPDTVLLVIYYLCN